MPASEQQQRRSRLQLVMIFVLFLIPPVGAWLTWQYFGERGVQGGTTNAGSLVSPARPLRVSGLATTDGSPVTDAWLRGHWTYVVFAPGGCDARCSEQLYLTRQVRLAMNKDIRRVQRLLVLVTPPAPELARQLATEHDDLRWVVSDSTAAPLLDAFRGDGYDPGGQHYFLVDPLGNLMMHYDLDVPAKGMMKDLQKLLKISQIG